MINQPLDFEKHIVELEKKVEELKHIQGNDVDISEEISKIEIKVQKLLIETFSKLTPWQKTQLARHPQRPHFLDYVPEIFQNFLEFHGDRVFGDDPSLCGGFATFDGRTVMIIGHQKGRTAKEKSYRNFGMSHPEGYRKAIRLVKLAEHFGKPVITFIDTPGAFPGIGAEERGQAPAIAESIYTMCGLNMPIISVVIGEGGSGGALGIGVCDRLLMLEYAVYSVISPEGCASILWKDPSRAEEAAECLRLTAQDILEFGIVDEIIREPLGGSHRNLRKTALSIKEHIQKHINELDGIPTDELQKKRYEKLRKVGTYRDQDRIYRTF